MSYRLLFGQTRGSQQLAKAALRKLQSTQEGEYDELLNLLCTRSIDRRLHSLPTCVWPVTCRSFEDALQEQSSYSSQDDFPLLGQRLAKIQEFTLRQQPSKLTDLWRDRRNPLQWYTFWAVLVVGGFSILIGMLQLFVGIAQLVVALVPPQSCRCWCTWYPHSQIYYGAYAKVSSYNGPATVIFGIVSCASYDQSCIWRLAWSDKWITDSYSM